MIFFQCQFYINLKELFINIKRNLTHQNHYKTHQIEAGQDRKYIGENDLDINFLINFMLYEKSNC